MGGWFTNNSVLRKYFIWFEIKLPLVGTPITRGAFVDVTPPSLRRYAVSKSLFSVVRKITLEGDTMALSSP